MAIENSAPWQSGVAILEDNVFERQFLPEGSAQSERRKDPRFSIKVPLQYRVQTNEDQWQAVNSMDVSNTGVRIHLPEKTKVGTRVELDVRLPGSAKDILIEGNVVWSKPNVEEATTFECGIAFQNLRRVTGKVKFLQYISDKLCHMAIKHAPKNLQCNPADQFGDLENAYRLIYKEYVLRGYCEPNDSKMHYSFYCVLPETRTFLLTRNDQLLGTITLILDSPCGLPMESLFHDSIEKMRASGRRMAEVSLLALDHDAFQRKSFSLTDFQKLTGTFYLFKVLF